MMGRSPKIDLSEPVQLAWRAFDRAAKRCAETEKTWCVTPAVPILFFGDLEAYRVSQLRVVTVGLNPSDKEFPCKDRFQRFPSLKKGNHGRKDLSLYIKAMSDYFRKSPYDEWFDRGFEPVLRGLGASYYKRAKSTALHTDICSPVATNPTWSKLHEPDKEALQACGVPLWRMLLEKLRPDIVVLSVKKDYLNCIKFQPDDDWKCIHKFCKTRDGKPRELPYKLLARWYEVGSKASLFCFGQAAQTPFGLLENKKQGMKQKAGELFLNEYKKHPCDP